MLLEELQKDFLTAFQDESQSDCFTRHLKSSGKLTGEKRLAIYRDSVTACLANSLIEKYPVCEKLVGKEFFIAMAYRYITQTPSRSANLFDYGESFANFVSDFEPVKSLPYLADLCRLEWARHWVYYAACQPMPDFAAIMELDEQQQMQLIFELPIASQLIQSNYPILSIWQSNQPGIDSDEVIDLQQGGNNLFVYRKELEVTVQELPDPQWKLLKAFQQQWPLPYLCEQLAEQGYDSDHLITEAIGQRWIGDFHCGVD